MNNLKLFMLMLGCKPPGRYTEQHDILFTISPDFASTETDARAFWKEAEKIHIDAWKMVTKVDGYKISIVPRSSIKEESRLKLFFINLGGYKEGLFDEFHYKILIVAESIDEANRKAKESTFFLHHPAPTKSARPHIDDKYGIDVDDSYSVEEILPIYLKDEYSILIKDRLFKGDVMEDEIHLGYQKYEKEKT